MLVIFILCSDFALVVGYLAKEEFNLTLYNIIWQKIIEIWQNPSIMTHWILEKKYFIQLAKIKHFKKFN